MKRNFKYVFYAFFSLALVFYLSSCSTTMNAIEHTKLQTQAKMSNTIFLNPVSPAQRTVYVQIRNTSQVPMSDLKAMIVQKLTSNGYRVIDNPNEAHYWVQANVLYMGKETQYDTFDGALAGGFGGALVGSAFGNGYGKGASALGGAALGSLAGALIGSTIHVDKYLGVVDIQIAEKLKHAVLVTVNSNYSNGESGNVNGATIQHNSSGSYNNNPNYTHGTYANQSKTQIQVNREGTTESNQYQKKTDRQMYRTRIVVEAQQTNMNLQQATPQIENLLSNEIAGIF